MSSRKLFIEAKTVLDEDLSLDTLLRQHKKLSKQRELDQQSRKLLAEVCFLIAREYLRQQELGRARQFAGELIGFYREVDTDTLESALPILTHALPDFMHEGVVEAHILEGLS